MHPRGRGDALGGMLSWGSSQTPSQAAQPKTPSAARGGSTGPTLIPAVQTTRHNSSLSHPVTALPRPGMLSLPWKLCML